MIRLIADNIISPLGMTSMENFSGVVEGRSALRLHSSCFDVREPFVASLFENRTALDGYSLFETLLIQSICNCLDQCGIDPASAEVGFIVSSIKGNVDLLGTDDCQVPISVSAEKIAAYFGNPNVPLVVSNACISGLTAMIHGRRLIETGRYRHVIVAGAELQSLFIVSGFQSLKALSPEPCRPFDCERMGLNLGEAAASVILSSSESGGWELLGAATRNDANHISGPSRTGEGSYQALLKAMEGLSPGELAFINVHGTATLYNDEMEAVAIHRAGLSEVPVYALKGYFGHTMGAAGILESIISMKAVEKSLVPATKGFNKLGVSCPVNVSNVTGTTDRKCFVKLISGFGGCNAAMAFRKIDAV